MKTSSDYKLLSKLYFRLLPYQALLLLINAANGIVDSLFASNSIGTTAMSAIGFYSPLTHFLFSISIMLVSGSQLLVGKAMGQIRKDEVNRLFSVDILLSLIISVFTALLLSLAAACGAFGIFVKDPVELNSLNMYIYGQSIGIPALVLGQQFFSFLSMENQTKRTMTASVCCVIANTLLDYTFVSVLQMDTLGLGIGSSLGLWNFCLVMAQYYFAGKSKMRFSVKEFNLRDCTSIMRLGYPGAISRFVEMFRCFVVNILILSCVGSVGLSAFAAVNSVMAVFWPIPFGMVAVTRMLLGISIGEEDRKSVTDIMRITYIRCFIVQCVLSGVIVALATPLTRMFYRDMSDSVYDMTLMGFRILPLCMPLAVISLTAVAYAQAMEIKFLSHVLPIVDGAIGVVSLSLFMIPMWKMNGLYIANVLNGVICFSLILGYAWYSGKRFPKNMESFLVLPDDFGAPGNQRIDIEIRSSEEVTKISERVLAFCKENQIDGQRAFRAALAMEEMAGNVIAHGFTKDSGSHSLDIRVIKKDDDLILRLRDDCKAFDPMQRADLFDPDDLTKNVGIRLMNGITKDAKYQNLLGMNVLTMRL
ncbi:MAG: ATP-binding protein [Lachnospiraceae bacterium]|nr:ATP-binding protein [Lachnospiraceae bacterium]